MSLWKGERSITRTDGDVLLQRSRNARGKEKLYVHGGLDSQTEAALPFLWRSPSWNDSPNCTEAECFVADRENGSKPTLIEEL
jgi:hypothetical protein